MSKPTHAIPIFKLYGEAEAWHTPDLIHSEEIAYRSRPNNWEIKPHRHADIAQLFYLKTGQAEATIDGQPQTVQTPCVLLVPMMTVHSFCFSTDIQGYVLSIAAPLLQQLKIHLGREQSLLEAKGARPLKQNLAAIDTLFTLVNDEYHLAKAGRELMLESTVSSLMLLLGRAITSAQGSDQSPTEDRNTYHYGRFIQLVEQHYRKHWSIEQYAAKLSISSAHLNVICQQAAGKTALRLIHQRLIEEAKRNLIYTSMTVAETAEVLGFNEPAYFARFFKRYTGMTAKDFRKSSLLRGQH